MKMCGESNTYSRQQRAKAKGTAEPWGLVGRWGEVEASFDMNRSLWTTQPKRGRRSCARCVLHVDMNFVRTRPRYGGTRTHHCTKTASPYQFSLPLTFNRLLTKVCVQ